jgi:DNA-binding phage protein
MEANFLRSNKPGCSCWHYGTSRRLWQSSAARDKTKLNRESLYKMLSERGNPELRSLDALLHALAFRLAVASAR